jgi:protein-tyrosine phosphatase
VSAADLIDIHCHLLPGLDDGPPTLGESLRLCEMLAAQGVITVVATPHVGGRRFHVKADRVRAGVDALRSACRERSIPLRILPGCDAQLQPDLLRMFDAGEVLTLGDEGGYLLLELPSEALPSIEGLAAELAERGATPILTHPERNPEFVRRPDRLAQLVSCGCLVQVTDGSFLGRFGYSARRTAESFLEEGLVHAVASDAHSTEGRRAPCLDRARAYVAGLAGEDVACALFLETPRRIVCGEPLIFRAEPVLPAEAPVRSRFPEGVL